MIKEWEFRIVPINSMIKWVFSNIAIYITRIYYILKLFNSSPPRPHVFVSLPVQSKISLFSTKKTDDITQHSTIPQKKVDEGTDSYIVTKNPIDNREKSNICKDSTYEDDILEKTRFIRSDEGIEESFKSENNNNILETSADNSYCQVNEDIQYRIWDTDDSLTQVCTDDITEDFQDIGSQTSDKIGYLMGLLENSDFSYCNGEYDLMSILLEIAHLWWLLLIFVLFILGLLAIIKELWVKAKIRFIRAAADTIKYIKHSKTMALVKYDKIKASAKVILDNSAKLLEVLKNAIDFMKSIRYITDKFKLLNKNSNKIATWKYIDLSNFRGKAVNRHKSDLAINNVAPLYCDVIVRMNPNIVDTDIYRTLTLGLDSNNTHLSSTMLFIERHLRYTFDLPTVGRPLEREQFIKQVPFLYEILIIYATYRNLGYAHEYIKHFSPTSGLPQNKVNLLNETLTMISFQFPVIYPHLGDKMSRIVELVNLYTQLLNSDDHQQLVNINKRYDCLEEILSLIEDIAKALQPAGISFEFRIINNDSSSYEDWHICCFYHYTTYYNNESLVNVP